MKKSPINDHQIMELLSANLPEVVSLVLKSLGYTYDDDDDDDMDDGEDDLTTLFALPPKESKAMRKTLETWLKQKVGDTTPVPLTFHAFSLRDLVRLRETVSYMEISKKTRDNFLHSVDSAVARKKEGLNV